MKNRHYLIRHFFLPCKTCVFACLISLFVYSNAWSAGINEEIIINADHMNLNIGSGNSVYTGNVRISQGKLILTGDKITVQQIDNAIEKITILGKPARYNHITETGETIDAESENMVYHAANNQLVLTTNAKLKQLEHQVSSQKIIYDTRKRIIVAGDKNNNKPEDTKKNRVSITLTPQQQVAPEVQVKPRVEPVK